MSKSVSFLISDIVYFLQKIGHVKGIELQVVEMTGEAGDAYFMDLRLLHTITPNASAVPRMMLTQRYLHESAYAELHQGK